ncbi:methylenetetrahydrofolate reductase, partial [Mesorhizobium sp. M00.F.Ca.ET.158.01.1.1]
IMRYNGKFLCGRKLTTPPQLFLGAAVNPFAPPFDVRPIHLGKKIAAGAQFVQTQYCFDVPMFKTFMQKARDLGHTEKVFILCGVGPLASAKTAKWIRSNVPGIHIPDAVIK